jgi:hypothetical protein
MHVEDLLARLAKVRKSGPNKWSACCPAHEDRSPSLAIKESDGVILLHCFAGCSPEDVCGSIGIEISELFPPSDKREWVGTEKPVKFGGGLRFSAIDALRCLQGEGAILCLLACDMSEGKVLSPAERERLFTATGRLTEAMIYLGANLAD